MDEQQLFEIAAKLHNVSLKDLRLKRRYLDVVVIETLDGTKYTDFVADLESAATADDRPPAAARPQHTRKR